MKILYTIPNPYGLGADRWMWEGYRDAFIEEGHRFFTLTEFNDFEAKLKEIQPDLFFLDFAFFDLYCHRVKQISRDVLKKVKEQGTKIFCLTGVGASMDKDEPKDKLVFFKQYIDLMDICYSNWAPEITVLSEKIFGRAIHFIPHAANTRYYFPDKLNPKFACDIAFVGSFYTAKREQFEKLLFPLLEKYRVGLYGPGWTKKDRILRLGSGLARKLKINQLTKFFNKYRMTISSDDERKLYASAKICINIHEYYKDGTTKGFSNEREFKVPASGGFQISDYIPGLERYFDLGKEIIAVKSPEEWFRAIDFYIKNKKERKEIQQRGTERVLREHTYHNRAKQLIDLYNSL